MLYTKCGDYMSRKYQVEKRKIKTEYGRLKIQIIKPKKRLPLLETPGVLWIHGGGYIHGFASMAYFTRAIDLVKNHSAVVIALDYRKAPKHKYPCALEDCYTALKYLKEHCAELGVNSDQIMVGGESAGGGLTCALTIYARDKGEVNIAYQMPLYPMIDCFDTPTNKDNHAPVWNTKHNRPAWKKYLGEYNQKSNISPYASPSRLEDFSNLPPAYSFVGDIEPFYFETVEYFKKLKEAGVDANLDVYPGWYHALDMLKPFRKQSKVAIKKFNEEFAYAKKHYFKKQN